MAEQPAKHGRDHLPPGYAAVVQAVSDPTTLVEEASADQLRSIVSPSAPLSYCYMRWVGTEAITVNTLTNPADTADDYEEGFIVDNDGAGFSLDLGTGIIQWSNNGEYLIWGSAEFGGGTTVGSKLEVVIDMGNSGSFSTFRIGNSIIADAINEVFNIPVQWMEFDGGAGHNSVRLLVDHNDAGGLSLARADLHVARLASTVTGTFYP